MDILTIGLIIFAVTLIALNLAALWWLGWMLYPYFFGGGPYVSTPPECEKNMLKLARITLTDTVVDLGSRDGVLVIAAARAGAKKSIGYEINPRLVKLSKRKAKKAGVEHETIFIRENMWKADLSNVDVVFVYQLPHVMKHIEKKLLEELKPGARVISNSFVMPDWKPKEEYGGIYLYVKE